MTCYTAYRPSRETATAMRAHHDMACWVTFRQFGDGVGWVPFHKLRGYRNAETLPDSAGVSFDQYALAIYPTTEVISKVNAPALGGMSAAYACSPPHPEPSELVVDIAVFSNTDFQQASSGKVLVAGAVELSPDGHARRIRLAPLTDASAASLHPFVASVAAPGARVVTDGWSGYLSLTDHAHTAKIVGKMAAHIVLAWSHRVFATSSAGRSASSMGCVGLICAAISTSSSSAGTAPPHRRRLRQPARPRHPPRPRHLPRFRRPARLTPIRSAPGRRPAPSERSKTVFGTAKSHAVGSVTTPPVLPPSSPITEIRSHPPGHHHNILIRRNQREKPLRIFADARPAGGWRLRAQPVTACRHLLYLLEVVVAPLPVSRLQQPKQRIG